MDTFDEKNRSCKISRYCPFNLVTIHVLCAQFHPRVFCMILGSIYCRLYACYRQYGGYNSLLWARQHFAPAALKKLRCRL
jgi:hypothetical protein